MYIEFDKDKNSILNSDAYSKVKLPEIAVACYSDKIIDKLLNHYNSELACIVSKTQIYIINYKETKITLFKSPMGSSWAAMVMEELIALGVNKFVYFGSCGVLDDIDEYEILIPTKALREEGTSYHYIEASKYIDFDSSFESKFIEILNNNNYKYKKCITWTTDAPFRETSSKVKKFLQKGITCVEMESSALTAVAKFRDVNIFIFFYSADRVYDNKWDKRCLGEKKYDKKMFIASIALDLAVDIESKN